MGLRPLLGQQNGLWMKAMYSLKKKLSDAHFKVYSGLES